MNIAQKKFVKYLFVGGSNVLLGYLIYASLILSGFSIIVAVCANYLFGILYSFSLNARWVFNHLGWSRLPIFTAIHSSMLITNIWLVNTLTSTYELNKFSAQAVILPTLALANYTILKNLVFREKSSLN